MTKWLQTRCALLTGGSLLIVAPIAAHAQAAQGGQPAQPRTTASPPAQVAPPADDKGLTDIIVTASRTGESSLQKTPIAVSVFSPAKLSQTGANSIADLAQLSPSLNVSMVTASPAVYIRGIGSSNVFNGADPNIALEIDGVYIARPFEQFSDYFDVDRVEVLRGPQGTTYGRNAVAGVVNIISRQPGQQLEGKMQVTAGNYSLIRGQAFLSGPLVPGLLSFSIAGNYENHQAYNRNIAPGNINGVADADHGGIRAQLRFTPTPSIDATTRIDYSRATEAMQSYDHLLQPFPAAPPFALANSTIGQFHTVDLDFPGQIASKGFGISEDIKFALDSNLSLRSLTAYRYGRYSLSLDADATENKVAQIFQGEAARQFSQEFNLTGKYTAFDFVLGAYYLREHNITANRSLVFPGLSPAAAVQYSVITPDLTATSRALFGQGVIHLPAGFNITLGGRYTHDTKDLTQSFTRYDFSAAPVIGAPVLSFNANVRPSWEDFTAKGGIDWQVTSNALLYVSYTEGFKSGGTNYAAFTLAGLVYRPERIKSYEAGLKTQLFDNRVRFNVTGFIYDYADLQVQQNLGPGNVQVSNAASARVRGVELELTAQIAPRFVVTASGTYLDARYRSFPTASVPSALAPYIPADPRFNAAALTFDASGNRINNAPEFAYVLSARYTQPVSFGELYAGVDYHWQDRTYFDPSNALTVSEPAYGLLGGAVGFNSSDRKWNIQLTAKNLLNKQYLIVRAANGLRPSGQSGAPRTVFVSVARSF